MLLGRPHDRADHRIEADVRRVLQCDKIVIPRTSRAATSHGPGWQQTLGLQLLAAEADDHRATTEIWIKADVAERPDWNLCLGCVDGDAAAVDVLQADHIIDMGVAGQQLGADAPHGVLDDAGDALHGRRYGEDVPGSD